jgi:hypothetical protein
MKVLNAVANPCHSCEALSGAPAAPDAADDSD